MKIENLTEGMVLKNYKHLCEVLGIKYTKSADSKKAQLKEFERFVKYKKDGNKFIIEEIFKTPKEKIDNRGKSQGSRGNNFKSIPGFNVEFKEYKSKGIYKIHLGNTIYIGKTEVGFRSRFMQHVANYNNIMPHTKKW